MRAKGVCVRSSAHFLQDKSALQDKSSSLRERGMIILQSKTLMIVLGCP